MVNAKRAQMTLFVTNRCNANCEDCLFQDWLAKGKKEIRDMTLETAKRALTNAEDRVVTLIGGETTLHPQLPELIREAVHAGAHLVNVDTNGLAFTGTLEKSDAYLQKLQEADAGKGKLVVSLSLGEQKGLPVEEIRRRAENFRNSCAKQGIRHQYLIQLPKGTQRTQRSEEEIIDSYGVPRKAKGKYLGYQLGEWIGRTQTAGTSPNLHIAIDGTEYPHEEAFRRRQAVVAMR